MIYRKFMLKESVTQFFLQCNFLFYVLLMKQKWEMKFVQYLPKSTIFNCQLWNDAKIKVDTKW